MIIDEENGGKESGGGEVRGRKWRSWLPFEEVVG